jgi:hypothetical protein
MDVRRVIQEEISKVLSEKETVNQFYDRFKENNKDKLNFDFLDDSFRNPDFELRLTHNGGVKYVDNDWCDYNKCETNTFKFIKHKVSQDDHRYFPVSGWMFGESATNYIEHFWIYDAVNNLYLDITPMKSGKMPYAYGGVINKNINNEILDAKTVWDVNFLKGKAMDSLYDSDKESNLKLNNFKSNEVQGDEALFRYIHSSPEYKDLSNLIGTRKINTIDELKPIADNLKKLKDASRPSPSSREVDLFDKLINQINALIVKKKGDHDFAFTSSIN